MTTTRDIAVPGPLLAGKRGLVMGVANERSIAWGIARVLHGQGAELAFSYQGGAFGRRGVPLAESIRAKIEEINAKGLEASNKEKNLLTVLELALEMTERGFTFQNYDLYKSDASEFIIEGNSLIPPFNSIPGLGTNAAYNIVKARQDGEFLSKEDLQQRGKVSKTILEYLDKQGCLGALPDQNQLSLF